MASAEKDAVGGSNKAGISLKEDKKEKDAKGSKKDHKKHRIKVCVMRFS